MNINESYKIRPMLAGDLSAVVALEESSGLKSRGFDSYKRDLSSPSSVFLIALEARPVIEMLIGMFSAELVLDELQIDNIAVDEAHRGRGVGSALLRAALETARGMNAKSAVLEVRLSNHSAQRLYLRHGFKIAGVRKAYYRGLVGDAPAEDGLIMICDIENLVAS